MKDLIWIIPAAVFVAIFITLVLGMSLQWGVYALYSVGLLPYLPC